MTFAHILANNLAPAQAIELKFGTLIANAYEIRDPDGLREKPAHFYFLAGISKIFSTLRE